MEEAIAEVRRLVDAEFPEGVTKVDINPSDYSSDEDGISVAPGSFDVFIGFGDAGISKNAKRNWSRQKGVHYVLEDYPAPAMSVGDTTWDEERRNKESARINESETGVEFVVLELKSDVKNEKQPTNYRVNVNFGSSPQNQVSLTVDSGSSILWAQSRIQISQEVPPGRSVVDLTIEDAARFQEGSKAYEILYGGGKKVAFSLFEATVGIGGLRTSQVFGAAKIAAQENLLPLGILGLGFSAENSPIPFHRTLVVHLLESGMIKRASFAMIGPRSEPFGTARPDGEKTRDRGWLVIGNLPDAYHNGITWCPALAEQYRAWVIRLNKVTVNGVVICENQLALVDTGSSYITTTEDYCIDIAKVVHGKASNRIVTYPSGRLSELSFTFGDTGGEATYRLNKEDLSLGPAPGSDSLRSPVTYMNFGNKKYTWILGGIFIDNMVTVFDYTGEKRIGFATRSDLDPVVTKI
ncbi:hypothetical protein NW768_002348 [Fusarium equiseti]|uniref:Peptidase A1 domain-containing protein n=1 Tax=Fusarium equiseti TaxID=61235 RepID=A0ABQ8RNM5_FUSEQ|nr:hypothetical protein NW768_002348 [Fusarium equiseti]